MSRKRNYVQYLETHSDEEEDNIYGKKDKSSEQKL